MKKVLGQKGFTLLELCVGMIILPIVLAAISIVINYCVTTNQSLMRQTEDIQNIRGIITAVTKDVQNAHNVTSPNYQDGVSISASQFVYSSDGSIKVGSGADADKLILTTNSTKDASGTLVPGRTIKLPAKGVTINFTRDGTDAKRIDVQLSLRGKTYNETITLLN